MNQHPNTHRHGSSKSSRREFAKFLGCAVMAGAGVAAARPLLPVTLAKSLAPVAIAQASEIPVGGYKLFRYPTKDDPCILVRLEADRFAAYSQRCTHLMCPIHFQAEKRQFYCPCHEGFFNAEDGSVLAGPPRRPLPRYAVELREGQVWVGPEQHENNG
ncbi:MAG: Rieske (2Fe-2S) protein [Verrucomicrobia bacterium]|nr:Rieske (2Fe-2S) protein [Verrucomicrobiota bacterium]